jgi:hypothetical protein
MLDAVYWAITVGLLGLFASFIVFGLGVALYELIRFYQAQFLKLRAGRAHRPAE